MIDVFKTKFDDNEIVYKFIMSCDSERCLGYSFCLFEYKDNLYIYRPDFCFNKYELAKGVNVRKVSKRELKNVNNMIKCTKSGIYLYELNDKYKYKTRLMNTNNTIISLFKNDVTLFEGEHDGLYGVIPKYQIAYVDFNDTKQ